MKVGDYVRTKSGFIDKIININDFREPSMKYALEQPSWNDDVIFIGDEDISKSSSDILELLKVGDFINGKKIIKIWEEPFGEFAGQIFTILEGEDAAPTIRDIKSIVTKEQFERMEYKVGEDKE